MRKSVNTAAVAGYSVKPEGHSFPSLAERLVRSGRFQRQIATTEGNVISNERYSMKPALIGA